MSPENKGFLAGVVREHILQALLVVAFGAWSIAVWSTKQVIQDYLATQTRIENNQATLQSALDKMNVELLTERASRREEILLIRERQDQNSRMVAEHESRLRTLEGNHPSGSHR